MIRPADTTPMPGEDRLPDGPGLFANSPNHSAREGYVIFPGHCKKCPADSSAGVPSGSGAVQADEYQSFEAFKRMDRESGEYKEFQDWLEWKRYREWKSQQ
jgi:hypothetical protein